MSMTALTFRLDNEIFAIDADAVTSIMEPVPVTRIPDAPPLADGLINVRGRIVPLADMRIAFAMKRRAADTDTRFVVIAIEQDGEMLEMAIIADKVISVTEFADDKLGSPPAAGMRWRPEFVRAVASEGDQFIIIPSLASIFDALETPGFTNESAYQ